MLCYCLKCREKTDSRNPRVIIKAKNRRIMVSSNCAVCGSEKSRFIKRQEAKGLLGSALGEILYLVTC